MPGSRASSVGFSNALVDSKETRLKTRLQKKFTALWSLLRAHPAVAIVPALVFTTITIACVLAVYYGARSQEDSRRTAATNAAMQVATALQLQFLAMANPVAALAAVLRGGLGLNYTQVHELFPSVAAILLAQVPTAVSSKRVNMRLAQQAFVSDVYPVDLVTNMTIGTDMLDGWSRYVSLEMMIRPQKVTAIGPFLIDGGFYLGCGMPVFISGVERDFNFSSPWPVSPFCPPELCWQEATKTKFWGVVSGDWAMHDMLGSNDALTRLQTNGFRWVLKQLADDNLAATPGYGDYVLFEHSDNGDVHDPVDVPVDLNTELSFQATPWVLSLSPDGGWTVSWEVPMYVAVVLVALAIALLLMALMASRVEHQDLLFSLVPKDMVKELKGSSTYVPTSRATTAIPAGSTPAEVMLGLLTECLLGNLPRPAVAVQLRAVLLGLQDVYRPAGIFQELRDACLDEDVTSNLTNLLSHDRDWSKDGAVGAGDQRGSEPAALTSTQHSSCGRFEDLESSLAMLVAGQATISMQLPQVALSPSLSGILSDVPKGLQYSSTETSGTLGLSESGPLSAVTTQALPSAAPPSTKSARRPSRGNTLRPTLLAASLNKVVQDELLSILGQAYSSWSFDAFALDAASQGHPLSTLGFYLMDKTGLMQHFKLKPAKVARFFQALEASYLDNPYHSRTHAADVLQTLHVILSQGGFLHSYADPVRHLACILAAAAHDVEHVGLNNDFLCKTEDQLALRYNDHSPSENHHLATLFTLLRLPGHDFMKHLDRETRDLVRKVAIEVVMSTDMKQHMMLVSKFKSVHTNHASKGVDTEESGSEFVSIGAGPAFVDETERLLSLQMAMKVADLGHLAETLEVHKAWVAGLEDEFFLQGDREREANMPITPLFDRNKPGVTKSQVGFYDYVAMPMFSSFVGVFKDVQPLLDGAAANLRFWKTAEAKK